jgi:histidinol phosphatase-like PHP family hydrolase
MKKILLLALFSLLSMASFPQRKILHLPSVPGYVTLTCDFHEHTVFSDGEVWPTVRLDEAERNGFDVIAFTDHIEYVPHQEYLKSDLNAAWKITQSEAEKRALIVVHGAEITRKMPPGHFNALFINDAEKLKNDDFMKQMQEAIDQGAFIQMNHPGWKGQRPDGIPRLDSIHHVLLAKKWIHAMEIYNSTESYPDVMDWCLKYNITMTGNMDIHGPYTSEYEGKSHAPMTLVFAKSKTEEDLKEALLAGRSLVWWDDTLAGKKELAKEFFLNSLEFGKVYFQNEKNSYRKITNKTDISYTILIKTTGIGNTPLRIAVPSNSSVALRLPKGAGPDLKIEVENIVVAKNEKLAIEVKLD